MSRKPSLFAAWNFITHSCQKKRTLHSSPGSTGERAGGKEEHALSLIIESWCRETAGRIAIELRGKCHFRIVRSLLGPRPWSFTPSTWWSHASDPSSQLSRGPAGISQVGQGKKLIFTPQGPQLVAQQPRITRVWRESSTVPLGELLNSPKPLVG